MRHRVVTGALVGLLLVAGPVGCARLRVEWSPGTPTPPVGVWQGVVWETPASLYQGVRRVTVTVVEGGSWTAIGDGAPCAFGVAIIRDGGVVLDIHRRAWDACMPWSLAMRDGRMWAVFVTSFNGRDARAVIDLQHAGR